MNLKQISKNMLKAALPLLLGITLLWSLYHESDWTDIAEKARRGINYKILLSSLVFGLAANVIRGIRWAMLIDSLGKPAGKKNVIYAVLGNYAINMVIPFRAGEIWRCGVTARNEGVPFTKLLGTVFVDRLMDTVTVVLLALCVFTFNLHFFNKFFSENPPPVINTLYNIASSAWTYFGIVAAGVLIWILFVKFGRVAVVQKAAGMICNVFDGVKSLWKIERKALFLFQSVLIWAGYFLYFYIPFYAFDFTKDLGIRIALIAFVMGSLGVAAPVQGGIGVWHFMVIFTLVAFGVNRTDADAFAFIVFAVQSVWVILTGLFGIIALPLVNGKNVLSSNKINHQTK
jgi:uncharacterized protein (TIRG00374 family)